MSKAKKFVFAALAALGMSPAFATDAKFDAFLQTVSGNKTTVTFGSGGTPVLTSSAPLGTPSVGNMGFETSSGDVFMRSTGAARLPTGGTLPIDTKLRLSRNALARGLARSTAVYAAWETGSALYSIWGDFGLVLNSDGTVGSSSSSSGFSSTGLNWFISGGFAGSLTSSSPELLCATEAAANSWGYEFTVLSSTQYRCRVLRPSPSSPYNVTVSTNGTSSTCPSGFGVTLTTCNAPSPSSFTQQQLEDAILASLAADGWPSPDARAVADAFRLNPVQPEVLPLIESQPASEIQVQVSGIPQGVRFQIGDPITETETITDPDGSTRERVLTRTLNGQAVGNSIQTTTDVEETITFRDPTGVITGVSTAFSTFDRTSTTTSTGTQDLECGIPGGPPCLIDETGTPEPLPDDGQTIAESILLTLQQCSYDLSACLPEMPDISWTFSLPTGCAPIVLGGGFEQYVDPIDICQWQSLFHDLMSMIWAGVGLFGAVALFRPRG